MPLQYVVFPEPGGPITICPNGILLILKSATKLERNDHNDPNFLVIATNECKSEWASIHQCLCSIHNPWTLNLIHNHTSFLALPKLRADWMTLTWAYRFTLVQIPTIGRSRQTFEKQIQLSRNISPFPMLWVCLTMSEVQVIVDLPRVREKTVESNSGVKYAIFYLKLH